MKSAYKRYQERKELKMCKVCLIIYLLELNNFQKKHQLLLVRYFITSWTVITYSILMDTVKLRKNIH